MQFISKRFKVLDPINENGEAPELPSNKLDVLKPVSKVVETGRKIGFFFRNLKGLQKESEAYTEYLEEGLDRQPDLAWTGLTIQSSEQIENGDHHYKRDVITVGGACLYSLPSVAYRLSLRQKFDDRTYESLCQLENVSYEDAVRCKNGTFKMVEHLHEIQAEEKRRSEMPVHFGLAHQVTINQVEPERVPLTVPPTLPWHHMENELMMDDAPEDLPELDEAWQDIKRKVEDASHFKNIRWTHKKAGKLPTSIKPKHVDHITHANYGTYGVFKFDVKQDLYVQVIATLDGLVAKPTASNSMDTPIPAFLPRWNRRDNYTIAMGAAGRIGREPVPRVRMHREVMEPYVNKAVDFIIQLLEEKGMRPRTLTPEDSWRWLASAHFPTIKKISYMEAFKKVIKGDHFIPASDFDNTHKAFPKNENYLEGNKPQRMILAGSLEMAAVLGPLCAILGNYFFSTHYTSKKIPEVERPRLAIERFGEDSVILNDMSAFEGSIDTWMKDHIEHRIMKYFFPCATPWIQRCNEKLRIRCQDVKCEADSIRCSGDPQTSLGNSFTNLASIFAAYMYATDNLDLTFDECKNRVIAWVEGDDSLVRMPPEFEDNEVFDRYREAFIMMGFATKMEIAPFVGDAGYCSMFFNRDLVLCPRVAQTFLDFPWDHSSKINRGVELLVMKAMSLHHTSPGQPLTWALCRHYSPRRTVVSRTAYNSYEFEELQREGFNPRINGEFIDVEIPAQLLGVEPSDSSRDLFARKYGICAEKQKRLERRILEMGVLGLLKKTKRANFCWIYLEKLCRVDGIDLQVARQYYWDRAHIVEDVPDDKIKYRIKRGENGKATLLNVTKMQHMDAELPAANLDSMPIDPLTYRKMLYEEKRKLSERARKCKCFRRCKIINLFKKKTLVRAGLSIISPAILFSVLKIFRLALSLSPLCGRLITETIRLPGRLSVIGSKTFDLLASLLRIKH